MRAPSQIESFSHTSILQIIIENVITASPTARPANPLCERTCTMRTCVPVVSAVSDNASLRARSVAGRSRQLHIGISGTGHTSGSAQLARLFIKLNHVYSVSTHYCANHTRYMRAVASDEALTTGFSNRTHWLQCVLFGKEHAHANQRQRAARLYPFASPRPAYPPRCAVAVAPLTHGGPGEAGGCR